jgi:hypothetical protein
MTGRSFERLHYNRSMRFAALLAALALCAPAAVRRVEVTSRTKIANNYEQLSGRVYFGVDPKLAPNRIVRDLQFAPIDARGEVEFSAEFSLLRPADPAKRNGTVLFEVSNRGGKGMLGRFTEAYTAKQGYTLAWLGWEWDIPASSANLLHFTAPHLRPDALPASGLVRSEFVPTKTVTSMPLGDRFMDPIAVGKALALYVRDSGDRPARAIPADKWKLAADGRSVDMASGFEAARLYEFVYEGKDPVVAGTGLAAVRDWISYLKHDGQDGRVEKRAIGFGISQSGRFLRQFLYDGFNADEQGRRVFDGVWADVAGAGRGSFNYRYAQPSRDGCPFINVFYPTDIFPFVDSAITERARAAKVAPKLFLTNGSYEYWGRVASLIHITPDGKGDAALEPDTRVYFVAAANHGPRSLPLVKSGTRVDVNPLDQRPVQRALLAALEAWVADGVAPPPSQYPKLAAGELATPDRVNFPVPGVTVPRHPRRARKLDWGPDLATKGIITREPPAEDGAWPLLVPQVDADGIDLGGIRLPEAAVPLATLTGWNLRAPERGASEEMVEFLGSIFPFAKTRADREKAHDPRLSIAERYTGRDDYRQRVSAVADDLVKRRFVLAEDRDAVIDKAMRLWDALAK